MMENEKFENLKMRIQIRGKASTQKNQKSKNQKFGSDIIKSQIRNSLLCSKII